MREEIAGVAEVATLLGVSRQRVHQLAARDDFPAPIATLSATKVWTVREVLAWAEGRQDRLKHRRSATDTPDPS